MILKENTVLSFWKYLSYGEKTFGIIVFVNVAIYLAWNVTKWKSTMLKYFIINEDKSNSVWSNLLSAFSHTSLWNLTANVIYLYYPLCKLGFVRAWPISIFPPYMGIEEFFVFYISACTFSSLSRIYIEPKLNISNKKSKYGAVSFAMFVSSNCLDCFRNAILVDQLYKHNLRMYFWNFLVQIRIKNHLGQQKISNKNSREQ
ncbi:hypothetical protein AGLY_006353 [Aphis glycines]|uniref:Peptidase S54 rhomboid domain-containing protein n=1 Tax=Aphis glycines TaxID=307491 RepID=A0A6G0TQT3_APHGL|nr:hypothetical protein AGLY_006353 [Aphis glycines]